MMCDVCVYVGDTVRPWVLFSVCVIAEKKTNGWTEDECEYFQSRSIVSCHIQCIGSRQCFMVQDAIVL